MLFLRWDLLVTLIKLIVVGTTKKSFRSHLEAIWRIILPPLVCLPVWNKFYHPWALKLAFRFYCVSTFPWMNWVRISVLLNIQLSSLNLENSISKYFFSLHHIYAWIIGQQDGPISDIGNYTKVHWIRKIAKKNWRRIFWKSVVEKLFLIYGSKICV